MKFLCDNCKAKYQIADEKVAGKTVRMKCRKCGHQIEVRAAITETSVSGAPPAPDKGAPRTALATSLSATKPRPASSPGTQPGGALAGAFQRNVQDAPATMPFPNAAQAASIEMSVTDEWYVAINGVPVGPVRISELRRKAATGAVTEDSLVWQEGLEEWRPVRSLPELAAIVREAALGNRPSLLAPPPPEAGRPTPPAPAPRPPPARPTPAAPMAPRAPEPRASDPPRPPPAAPSRSNVVPLRVAASAAEEHSPQTAPLGGPNGTALAPVLSPPAPAPAPVIAVADPFASPPPPAVAAATSPSMGSGVSIVPAAPAATPSLAPAPPARKGPPLWFWPFLVFVAVFGGVAAFYVFKGQPPPPPVVIQVPTPTAPTTAVTPSDDIPPPPTTEPTASASAAPTSTAKVATNTTPKTPTTAAPTTTSTAKTADLSGLLGGANGPSAGPGGGTTNSAGGTIDAATVQRIVRERSPAVKRTCWDRGGDQKSSAKVTVAITVGPSGRVDNASATGDDPVIAKCIENQVRTWQFPATGSTTTVNVPFVFVRQ